MKKSAKNIKTSNDERRDLEEIKLFIEDSKKIKNNKEKLKFKIEIQNINSNIIQESSKRLNSDRPIINSTSMKSLFKPTNLDEDNEYGGLLTTHNLLFSKIMKTSPYNSPEKGNSKFKSIIFKRELNPGSQSDRLRTMNNELKPSRNRLASTKLSLFKYILKKIIEPPKPKIITNNLVLKPIRKTIENWNKIRKDRQNFYSTGSLNMPLYTQMNDINK
jgi:hypothetical protein